jgi:hypothetical protein
MNSIFLIYFAKIAVYFNKKQKYNSKESFLKICFIFDFLKALSE